MHGGETGVLARAFAKAIEEVNAKTAALEQEVQEHRRTVAARDHHAERERLFSAAVESSNDAIITMSLDGTITGWNSAAERLFGHTRGGSRGQKHHPARARSTGCRRCRMRCAGSAGAKASNTTKRCACERMASRIEVSLSISPIKSPSGATIGISKVARDITEDQQDQAGAAATDRGASPHLRNLAGSDHGDGCAEDFWFRSARAAKPYWAIGRRK